MVTSACYLTNVSHDPSGKVRVAGGAILTSVGRGTMRIAVRDHMGKQWRIDIIDVLIVPGLGVNLLSVSKLAERGTKPSSFDLQDPYLETEGRRTRLTYMGGLYRWRVVAKGAG